MRRVRVAPQSKHLARFSAMVLPQLKHRVMCLQLLPQRSVVDPHPLQLDFNCRSVDIFSASQRSPIPRYTQIISRVPYFRFLLRKFVLTAQHLMAKFQRKAHARCIKRIFSFVSFFFFPLSAVTRFFLLNQFCSSRCYPI